MGFCVIRGPQTLYDQEAASLGVSPCCSWGWKWVRGWTTCAGKHRRARVPEASSQHYCCTQCSLHNGVPVFLDQSNSHSNLALFFSPTDHRVRRSRLSPKPCLTSMGTRSGCERQASLRGARIHRPEPALPVGREGAQRPTSTPRHKLLPLSLSQDPLNFGPRGSIFFGAFNLTAEV